MSDEEDDFDIEPEIEIKPEPKPLIKRTYETKKEKQKKYLDAGHQLKNRRLLFSYDSSYI